MKILIVDDEIYARKAIVGKLDWQKLGFETPLQAEDGVEAFRILKETPVDVVVTDIKMPGMDGIGLAAETQKLFRNIEFVIISGHAEFEYARKAIRYGITEYLLKPVTKDDLEGVLERICQTIKDKRKENEEKKFLEERYDISKRDQCFSDMLKYCSDNVAMAGISERLGVDFTQKFFTVLVLDYAFRQHTDIGEIANNEEIISGLIQFLEKMFSRVGDAYAFRCLKNTREIVIVINHAAQSDQEIRAIAGQVLCEWFSRPYLISSIGVGAAYKELCNLKTSYSEASFAAREKILKGSGRVIVYDRLSSSVDAQYFFNDSGKKMIEKYFSEGKYERILEQIDTIFALIKENRNRITHSLLMDLCLEIYQLLDEIAGRPRKDSLHLFGDKYDFLEFILQMESIDAIRIWIAGVCRNMMKSIGGAAQKTGEEIVQMVVDFINEHYYENISLSGISQKYFIHPNYFCRLFKNVVSESFSDYVTKIRMQKAKELLEDTSLKLSDIGEMVGYNDPSYFGKVFKKHYRMSPGDYMNSCGKLRNVNK